jgi:hypothetical protein
VSFKIGVPSDTSSGTYAGRAIVSACGRPVANVSFSFSVSATEIASERPSNPLTTVNRKLRSAFASYCSRDREEAFARIQGMKKVLPDLDVFVDVVALRSGQQWEKELRFQLPAKDAFFLFWSRNAAHSKEVEKEWRLALELRGLEYIDPVPLIDPRKAPPPKELASLHFNDLYLAYIESRSENSRKPVKRHKGRRPNS